MLRDANAGVAAPLEDSLAHRMETLQEVLMGQMKPLERRLELAGRRPGIVFGAVGSPLGNGSPKSSTHDSSSNEEPERDTSGRETADSVEVEVESPSEDGLRVANFLAEKHSDAEAVALSSSDTVEVREAAGGTFSLDVTDVLEREFGEVGESETTASSAPSMSTAAAEKLG